MKMTVNKLSSILLCCGDPDKNNADESFIEMLIRLPVTTCLADDRGVNLVPQDEV